MNSSRAASSLGASSSCSMTTLAKVPRRRVSSASASPAPHRVNGQQRAVQASVSMAEISAVSQLITTGALCVGAYMLLNRAPLPEQDYEQGSQPCPVCNGTGFEECLCHKWSDGDVGCNSCSKTGYMRCRSCNGGGRAIPRLVKLEQRHNNLQ